MGRSESREEECKRFIAVYGQLERIEQVLEAQFHTLHIRAQVLLGICGVLLTASVMITTGKVIARPDFPNVQVASRLMIAAGVSDVLAAAIVIAGVLHIRWVTPGGELHAWVMTRLDHRDRKTRALHTSIALLLVSMILYQVAASLVLAQL